MAKAYSDDLRRKVLERHQLGEETLEDLAERFGVSIGWVKKISASFTRTGQMERPAPVGVGRPRKATAAIDCFVSTAIKDEPDLTLAELQLRLFQQQQLEISIGALWNLLRRLNLRLKKNHSRR
jgi:transposase